GMPDLGLAREFATELHREFPDKMLAYNCSPSFNWSAALGEREIATFQDELGEMGYRFQFITLAGFHALNHSMFTLAHGYASRGMPAYVELQDAELGDIHLGYTAIRHQHEVGTGYFDKVTKALNSNSTTLAMAGSTEAAQF
ncbi:MAG: isocitrate lyase, partial [Actinomycetota bacterium]|nr:isocitrate lyase [Actinomycetota bacterium]